MNVAIARTNFTSGLHVGYFFLPHEFNGNAAQTGLYGSDLRKALDSLACVRLLILDTCRSSQAAHENRDTTIITLAACLPMECSMESPGLQNGVFTRAFVEALTGAADVNKDNQRGTSSQFQTGWIYRF